jgi:choline monooxygenase
VKERFAHVNWPQLRNDRNETRTLEVAANWKIIAENFVESYHVPWVHPTLNKVNPMSRHYQILGGHSYLGQGGTDYQGDPAAQRPLMSGWTDRSRYEALYIFPNLILGPLPDMMFSIMIEPVSAARSRERVGFFFAGDEAMEERFAESRQVGAKFVVEVNSEDVSIVESVQRGRRSPAFVGGQFARPQEETSLQLQKIVAAHLLGVQQGKRADEMISLPVRDIYHPVAA